MEENKSNYDIAADLGFPPIKWYQDEVAAKGYLTNREYRTKLREEGFGFPSRHQVLMSQDVLVGWGRIRRAREEKRICDAVTRVTAEFEHILVRVKANAISPKEKEIARDRARGAYESRTFLENTLREKGIEPAAEISDMKAQYEEWKWLSRGTDSVPEPSEGLGSPVTNKWARTRRAQAEEAAT